MMNLVIIHIKSNEVGKYIEKTINFSISQGMVQSKLHYFDLIFDELEVCVFKLKYKEFSLMKKAYCDHNVYNRFVGLNNDYSFSYSLDLLKIAPLVVVVDVLILLFLLFIYTYYQKHKTEEAKNTFREHLDELLRMKVDKNDQLYEELTSHANDSSLNDYSISIFKTKIMKIIGLNNNFKKYIHDITSPLMVINLKDESENIQDLKIEATKRLIDLNKSLTSMNHKHQTSILDIKSQIESIASLFNFRVNVSALGVPCFVKGSSVSVFKIFTNLLKNSQARISKKGKVDITIDRVGDHYSISYACIDKSVVFKQVEDNVSNESHQRLGSQIIKENIEFLNGEYREELLEHSFVAILKLPVFLVKITKVVDEAKNAVLSIKDEIPLALLDRQMSLPLKGQNITYEIQL